MESVIWAAFNQTFTIQKCVYVSRKFLFYFHAFPRKSINLHECMFSQLYYRHSTMHVLQRPIQTGNLPVSLKTGAKMKCYVLAYVMQKKLVFFIYSIWSRGQISNFEFCCTPQEEKVGYYFQSGPCLGASETHVLLSFMWSGFCKWPVITVTPQTLKIAVHKIQDS